LHSLSTVAEQYKMPVIVSTHPRTRKQLDELGIGAASKSVTFMKPLGFCDYIQLQRHAFCVISDSGSLTEESSIMNFPAISIRQANERPEGIDVGTLIMSGLMSERVLESVRIVTNQYTRGTRDIPIVSDYDRENVSKQLVRVIISYIDYINRTVWHK
jgi:UDP-N-acetylglucosamine 2-epimerase